MHLAPSTPTSRHSGPDPPRATGHSRYCRLLKGLGLLACAAAVAACAGSHYKKLEPGKLSGKLKVQWMAPDRFLYEPDSGNPLTFERADGESIVPRRMMTDGGSIPRPFQVFRNFSPWGYGPAFVVHDWLFHMQDCKIEGYEDWTLEEAALVMSEVMRTMMEDPDFDFGSKTSVYMMYKAVRTTPARRAWEDGICKEPGSLAGDDWRPTETYYIDFSE